MHHMYTHACIELENLLPDMQVVNAGTEYIAHVFVLRKWLYQKKTFINLITTKFKTKGTPNLYNTMYENVLQNLVYSDAI